MFIDMFFIDNVREIISLRGIDTIIKATFCCGTTAWQALASLSQTGNLCIILFDICLYTQRMPNTMYMVDCINNDSRVELQE